MAPKPAVSWRRRPETTSPSIDDTPPPDSRAICRYLAETYEHQGYPFLLGKDVLERASIEQWLRNEEHAFDPPSRALFCHIAFPLHDEDDDNNEDINREKRKLEEVLEVYEQRLGESDYLAGNKFTLADLVHLPGTHHVITSERFAYLYDSRKNVQKWWNRISARDSWQQVLKDMRTVEEEHRKEEHEKQQQQWQTAHLPQFGVHDIHISHRQQEGTKSQRVLVAPPSTGTIITSIPPAPQEHENTSDHKPSTSIQRNQGGFFTTNEKPQPPPKQTDYTTQEPPSSVQSTKSSFFTQPSTPTTGKTYQRTDQKPSHKDASSPSKTSQISPKETPDKTHLSDFFKVSGYKHEAGSLAKPQASSKIPGARQTSEAVAPDKSSPGSAKSPHRITETDYSESESKPFGVRPQVDKRDTHKLQTPYGKPPEQRVADSSVGPEAGEKQKSTMSTPYAQVETAKQSIHAGSRAIAKGATEADQDRAPSSRAQEVQSGVQDAQRQAKDGIDENERFSTKRLRRMFNPDAPDSQDPAMEEEASAISSDVYDREKHTTTVPANKMSSSPPTGTRAPYTPEIADERRATSPPNGVPYNDRATAGPEKTPPVQQVPPAAPSTDKLAKTEGADTRAPQQTPTDARSGSALVQRADPRARVINDEQIYKSSTMGRKAPEATRKASDSQGTSEVILDTRGKGHEEIPGFRDTGNRDATKKSVIDKRTAELTSGSQQITEPIKGVSPTSSGTPGDKSTRAATAAPNAAVPAPVQEPTSGGQNASAVLREGNLDASGKNEAAKPSPGDPRSMLPATPGRLAPNPDTQFRDTSGQFLKPSPQVSFLSDTRNEKAGIAETSQTSLVLPNDQPGMQASRNAGAASSVPPPVKSPEDNNKTYKEEAATQELPRDQSRTQLAENKKQGDDAAPTTRIGKREDGDSLANTSGNNTIQAQGTTNDVPSKLQIQSDQNKSQLSKDGGKKTKETANSPSLSTSKEVLPSPPEKTKQEQQLQGDQSGMSLQYSVKQGSEAASLGSGTVQQKKKDLSTDADKNYEKTSEVNPEEKIPSDTQQVKSNRSNSKATQFEGEKGNLPESERRGS
ncbi:Glutathione S-transferase F10 [Dichanthelium oligosanthes]|uniref:glutathione transferase n=1 Tax=Dichanthelium oligosanthes TaxID=888268 RepID=A0A1E5VHG5_9POAL|nr:Glutathione S-transferase F10 [Dichanthelium oligosanthes]